MKKIIPVLVLIFFTLTLKSIFANANLMIVNQVRGDECCDQGSNANLKIQMENLNKLSLPASFLWRYDALKNPDFQKILTTIPQDNFNHGLWVEVTPLLAKDAKIDYHGAIENWYKAENSLLVGYNLDERIKLTKTLAQEFKKVFQKNPVIAGAWGIDTQSLNLLHDEFGVEIWQNVREQFGLDSYSTIGAPNHYPFRASQNWHLIPTNKKNDNILIIRNAITDPLYSYGDTTSSFTSQPNDYALANRKIDYFLDLINQIIEQPNNQIGWGVVGLENSMEEKFQKDFIEQLDIIKEKESNGKIKILNVKQALDFYKNNNINIYSGKDLINKTKNQAYWITTPFYQLRLRIQNNEVYINDIRAYDDNFTDPYQTQIAQNSLWEIVPAIIDSSLYLKKLKQAKTQFYEVRSDSQAISQGLKFPNIKNLEKLTWTKTSDSSWNLSYQSEKGRGVKFNFNLKNWQANFQPEPINMENNFPFNDKNWTSQQIEKAEENIYNFEFKTNPQKLNPAREKFKNILFPEIKTTTPNLEKSTLVVNNKFAQAGRNPIQLVFYPTDKDLFPVIPENWKVKTTPNVQTTIISQNNGISKINLNNLEYQKVKVDLLINGQITQSKNAYFVEDCLKSFDNCKIWPHKWFNFMRLKISDKLRK